jgi:hypothetical protein
VGEFYAVDRKGIVAAGATLIRQRISFTPETPPEFQEHLDRLFPDGVTNHGDNWFVTSNRWLYYVDPHGVTRWEPATELIFEYVRRSGFPERPSRFDSYFGCETLEDARTFRDQFAGAGARIVRLEADGSFRADMTALNMAQTSPIVASYYAHQYWKGEAAKPQPPFWEHLLLPPVRVLEVVEGPIGPA